MSNNPYGSSDRPNQNSNNSDQPTNPYAQNPSDYQAQQADSSTADSPQKTAENSYGQQSSPYGYGEQQGSYSTNYSAYQQGNIYGGGSSAVGASQPRPHVGLGGAFSRWGKNLFHFSGRASRSEFWWIYGAYAVFMAIASGIYGVWFMNLSLKAAKVQEDYEAAAQHIQDTQMYNEYTTEIGLQIILSILIFSVLAFVLFLLVLSLWWRRLQDAGFHGALVLLTFIGLSIVPFILAFFPSSPNGYKYDKQVDFTRP